MVQMVPKLLPWAADACATAAYDVSNVLLDISGAAAVAPMLTDNMTKVCA